MRLLGWGGGVVVAGAPAPPVYEWPPIKPSGPAGPALQERVSGIVSVVVRVTWQWAEIVFGLVQVYYRHNVSPGQQASSGVVQ